MLGNRMQRGANRRRAITRGRFGAVTVEFALTAPVLFLVIFASLEFSRANMLKHTAANAAYEGARAVIVPGATASSATTAALNALAPLNVRSPVITINPSTIAVNTQQVTVTVQIPMNSNGYFTPIFFRNKNLQESCTLSREVTGLENGS